MSDHTDSNRLASLTDSPVWQALQAHVGQMRDARLIDLFAADPRRADALSLQAGALTLDYSKNRVSSDTLRLLFALARERGLPQWRERMFRGEKINHTEDRPVLHTALRAGTETPYRFDGQDIMPGVRATLARMRTCSDQLRSGQWRGYTGEAVTDVVSIGIGGSSLGPALAVNALAPLCHQGLTMHFVSNIDGAEIGRVIANLRPQTTLFVVASKTFQTQETRTNAQTARDWIVKHLKSEHAVSAHFIAVTANPQEAQRFGIRAESIFEFWDWVGGRFSLWSAIGLPIAIAIGMDGFEAMLSGARAMDDHFRSAPLERNMPVILGLLGIWYINFFGCTTHAVLPYDSRLSYLPSYLQQLEMESNGKQIDRDGRAVDYATAPVVWGSCGTDGQHAFFQLLHQGTHLVPCDFLIAMHPDRQVGQHHRRLESNFLAQTEALMRGRDQAEARSLLERAGLAAQNIDRRLPYVTFEGNRPSNALLYARLSPSVLGSLIALYEHKVFVQGVIWNINSFDQWGVELGKQLAGEIEQALAGAERPFAGHDGSTQSLRQTLARTVRE